MPWIFSSLRPPRRSAKRHQWTGVSLQRVEGRLCFLMTLFSILLSDSEAEWASRIPSWGCTPLYFCHVFSTLFTLFSHFFMKRFFSWFLALFSSKMAPKIDGNLRVFAFLEIVFFDVNFGRWKTWILVFYLHEKLEIKVLRGRQIDPKMAPKSYKIVKKRCLEMLLLFDSFFSHIFSDLGFI